MKALYELEKREIFEKALPRPKEDERCYLSADMTEHGCLNPIMTFHGVIIDGHTRYDICHELGIPFEVEEMEFEDDEAALLWILRNQLGRRNLTDFEKCELVLPFEEQLKKEAKERQGQRNDLKNIPENLQECSGETFDGLGNMAGVSGRNMRKAKWLHENADEGTLNKLRRDEISIHRAYTDLRGTPKESKPSPSSKIIQFPKVASHQPDWSAEEEPDWSIENEGDWPAEEAQESAETPTSTFDPGPDMDDINAIIKEIQDNSRHYADRFIELLSRIQPKDATSENIGFISTTIDSIFTSIKKQIKEVHINEQ